MVNAREEGWKIARILQEKLFVSHRLFNKLKMQGKILVNGQVVYANYLVHDKDMVLVKIDFVEEDGIVAEVMPLSILWEDNYFLAVNKPAGMVVHPSANHLTHTLANGIKYYLNNQRKIRAINRLDRDTSGIVLFAKNEYIQERMILQKERQKEYLAIVTGTLPEKKGTICAPIARKEGSIMEREVSEAGQEAITHYEVLNEMMVEGNTLSLLKLQLATGRTHQIRVHMAYLGTPILGDTLYGKGSTLIARQALHAYRLQFFHPITGANVSIEAPIPKDMQKIICRKTIENNNL